MPETFEQKSERIRNQMIEEEIDEGKRCDCGVRVNVSHFCSSLDHCWVGKSAPAALAETTEREQVMEYEIMESTVEPGVWTVEGIDRGDVYKTNFYGPLSAARAAEYFYFKTQMAPPARPAEET